MRPAHRSGDALPRKPITGIAGCCARTASGHAAAAPPSSVMNLRRLMQGMAVLPRRSDHQQPTKQSGSVYRTFSLPPGDRQVLGADLNCSESRVAHHICPALFALVMGARSSTVVVKCHRSREISISVLGATCCADAA